MQIVHGFEWKREGLRQPKNPVFVTVKLKVGVCSSSQSCVIDWALILVLTLKQILCEFLMFYFHCYCTGFFASWLLEEQGPLTIGPPPWLPVLTCWCPFLPPFCFLCVQSRTQSLPAFPCSNECSPEYHSDCVTWVLAFAVTWSCSFASSGTCEFRENRNSYSASWLSDHHHTKQDSNVGQILSNTLKYLIIYFPEFLGDWHKNVWRDVLYLLF